jgi:ribonucrease Y
MDALTLIVAVVGGALLGLGIARALGPRSHEAESSADAEAETLRNAAEAEAAEIIKVAEVEAKELALKLRSEAEEAVRARDAELARREQKVSRRERDLQKADRDTARRQSELDERERSLDSREHAAEAMVREAGTKMEEATRKLEEVAGLTSDQARKHLESELLEEAKAGVASEIQSIEDQARDEATARSKEIIATAIQRYASEFVSERTTAVVPLPSDDMKGRLIGREGRNIRALEAAAGIDMIIDDTSEVITISCFNPVRREIARLAIGKLVADGRIHPTRIEEVVQACEAEVELQCKEAGEQAIFDLGLSRVHPELVKQLGRLKFRHSYTQNLLQHSIEVGYLAGLMAAELGMNAKTARRAGLLHDIGKAVDHEQEGDHAEVGARLARKHGESAKVCQAIASHDGNPNPSSLLDHVVDAANQLSLARPGARREQLASYVQRLEDLEALCSRHHGVKRAHALLAGREVRVMVENDKVDDAQALMLSKELARQIETECTYPGQVRVVVVRETRASDYAR